MTDVFTLALTMIVLPVVTGIACAIVTHDRARSVVSSTGALTTAAAAAALVVEVVFRHEHSAGWLTIDQVCVPFVVANAFVGLMSVLLSSRYLSLETATMFSARRAPRWYLLTLHVFWATLLAVPVIGNLAVALIAIEATTATSALLIAYSGRRRALEAGWKYLLLTSLGLTVALYGIVVLYASSGTSRGLPAFQWQSLSRLADSTHPSTLAVVLVLIVGGLAAKIGWAPVHNWLPDAHSEAPSPVSMLLSAALLPSMILVAWRVKDALGAQAPHGMGDGLFIAFGLLSLAVAVPFLWQPMPWKRFLAYSSLEHMGVIAVGIGIGGRLAVTGVVIHVVGHALAKWLGFHTVMPLMGLQHSISKRPPRGIASVDGATASAVGISLYSLGGLPPAPLFVSELLILAGAVASGRVLVAACTALLLALAFLGITRTLLRALVDPAPHDDLRPQFLVGAHMLRASIFVVVSSIALAAIAVMLPASYMVRSIARGVS